MLVEKYKVAKYIRLSDQDRDKFESDSVQNQRDLINNFIENQEDLEIVGEYVDDGYTGANFNRPRFKDMIKDIEDGKINCIITKDLSRFGRDHIDTGYYLERYLPKKNIRYISICDKIDTKDLKGLQFLSFKLSFNDYYLQDISKKTKSVKKKKALAGEYQSGIPVYGYKKDSEIKNHLIIDENVSEIVKEIFDMYANKGMSTLKIADELNRRNINPPSVYLNMGCTKKKSKHPSGEYLWYGAQISLMLHNQTYLGHVVTGKSERISPKIKKLKRYDKSDYIITQNMHEPIIDEQLWNKVQERLNRHNEVGKHKNYKYLLRELAYCGECGSGVTFMHTRRKNNEGIVDWEKIYLRCKRKNNHECLCENKMISEDILLKAMKQVIKNEIDSIDYTSKELKEIYNRAERKARSDRNKLEEIIEDKNMQLARMEKDFEKLYEKKIEKTISTEEFTEKYNKIKQEKEKVNLEIYRLQQEKEKTKEFKKVGKRELMNWKRLADKFINMENPDSEIIRSLVERVEFDKEKNIKIKLKFSDPYRTDDGEYVISQSELKKNKNDDVA